jgi:hypothetical protein
MHQRIFCVPIDRIPKPSKRYTQFLKANHQTTEGRCVPIFKGQAKPAPFDKA